jgi:hypothetical protein
VSRALAALAVLATPASAWALCPNCLGQNETLTPTMKLVGVFLLVPPIVAWFVVRAIRGAEGINRHDATTPRQNRTNRTNRTREDQIRILN